MTPEENDLLIRMDERLEYIQDKVKTFCTFKDAAALDIANLQSNCRAHQDLPARVTSLEKWRWGLTGAFAFMILLVGWGWVVIGGAK